MSLTYSYPGVYIEEKDTGARPIQGVSTTTAAFLGAAPNPAAAPMQAQAINNFTQFKETFCGASKDDNALANAVFGYFANGGSRCFVVNVAAAEALREGLAQIASNDEIAMVSAPGRFDSASTTAVLDHCEELRDRFAILDASGPDRVKVESLAVVGVSSDPKAGGADPGLRARASANGFGAQYFPWLRVPNALNPAQEVFAPPSGHVAGVYARTDAQRGVFKAPANETLRGVLGVAQNLTNAEQGRINRSGVNCIRSFSSQGIVVWGARTLAPDGSNWTYVNVRRLLLFIEQSIYRSTGWVVFEPNDRPLWKSIRRDVSAFLTMLWRSGALAGASAEQAFFVKCDEETNPQARVDVGIVTIVIGVAPVKPAEFVVFEIGQTTGQAEA
jgi:phage tail sheath protein FI